MTKTMINCYVCGSWAKYNKNGIYTCPKCKSKYIIKNGKVFKYYETFKNYIED